MLMHTAIEHHADARMRPVNALLLDLVLFAKWLSEDPTRLSLKFEEAQFKYETQPWRLAPQGKRIRVYGHYAVVAHVSRLGRRIVFDDQEGQRAFIKAEDQIYRACGQSGTDALTGRPCIFI